MNNENIKILLTIQLAGGSFVRQKKADKIVWHIIKQDLSQKKLPSKEGNKIVESGIFKHYPLVSKDAVQKIKINKEAYDLYISDKCPDRSMLKTWKKLKPIPRLEWHLQKICNHFNGKSFSYELLDDQIMNILFLLLLSIVVIEINLSPRLDMIKNSKGYEQKLLLWYNNVLGHRVYIILLDFTKKK